MSELKVNKISATDGISAIEVTGGFGDLIISGDLTVSGNDIKDSGGNTIFSFDGSGNIDRDINMQVAGTANMNMVSTNGMSSINMYGSGNSMSDGDNIGAITFYGTEDDGTANSVQVGYMVCEVADGSFAYSSSAGAMIKFGVVVDASTTVDEVLFIDGNTIEARVGIGTQNPEKILHVANGYTTDHVALIENTTTSDNADCLSLRLTSTSANAQATNKFIKFDNGGSVIGWVIGDTSGGITITDAFTGKHPSVTKYSSSELDVGLIMSSTGEIWVRNIATVSTGLPKVTMSITDNDKGVFGIISSTPTFDSDANDGIGEWSIYDGYYKTHGVDSDESAIVVNSLGEGLVWVTDKNGELQAGDYICSTVVPGHGGKQADDLLHNYTVAKCVETIDWSSVTDDIVYEGITYKKYLVACTYNCG